MTDDQPTPTPPPASGPVEGSVFTHSATIAKLAQALATAQAKYEPLKAASLADAEKYTYRYADLAAVLDAVRPALAGQGIAILQGVSMQRASQGGGLVVLVESRLVHQSGEWIATTLRLPTGETAPQKVGSLVTYLRRYGLLALSGVASEDDDGKGASETPAPRPSRTPKTEPATAKPVPANELPPAKAKPTKQRTEADPPAPARADTRHAPLSAPGSISAADRGLLFKVAKEQGLSERQVKALILALFGYASTSQIQQGAQFGKVLNAMENPGDHGVTFAEDDTLYSREADPNALPVDVTEGM